MKLTTDYATIYLSDPSLLGSKFFRSFSEIKDYEGLQNGAQATGLKLDIGIRQITMNFMSADKIPSHLNGLEGFVRTVGCANDDKLVYALNRIRFVRFVVGCVVNPGFDKDGKTIQFLYNFTRQLNGLLFIRDCLVDYDGEILATAHRNQEQDKDIPKTQ